MMLANKAGGDAITEGHSIRREAVVDRYTQDNMLHKVLYL
jgi:hypothetical protein